MRRILCFLTLTALALAGCNLGSQPTPAATPDLIGTMVAATLAAVPSPTPAPPTPTLISATAIVASPTPEGLHVGGHAQVAGTQSDGLRLRSDPGLQTTTLLTIQDGTVLSILDGPREADGIRWWRLRSVADGAEGWAAQDYLVPVAGP